MGLDRTIRFPTAETPAWEAIQNTTRTSRRVGPTAHDRRNARVSRTKLPDAGWKELRVGTAAGMITIRRRPGMLSCVVWGNPDAALNAAWTKVIWACAEAGNGSIEMPAGLLSAEDFAQSVNLLPRSSPVSPGQLRLIVLQLHILSHGLPIQNIRSASTGCSCLWWRASVTFREPQGPGSAACREEEATVTVTVRQLAEWVRGEVLGDGELPISNARTLTDAQPGDITFVEHDRHLAAWHASRASAAIVPPGVPVNGRPLIRVADPLMAFARIVQQLRGHPAGSRGHQPYRPRSPDSEDRARGERRSRLRWSARGARSVQTARSIPGPSSAASASSART